MSDAGKKSGLAIGRKKIVTQPRQVIGYLDQIIAALSALAPSTGNTLLESDPLIDAHVLASGIRKSLQKQLDLRGDISPEVQEEKEAVAADLRTVAERTDRLFELLGLIVNDANDINREQHEVRGIIPGLDVIEKPGVINFAINSEAGPDDQRRAMDFVQAEQGLNFSKTKLEFALTGGTYDIIDGVYTGVGGNIDVAGSIKATAALGQGLAG